MIDNLGFLLKKVKLKFKIFIIKRFETKYFRKLGI